MATHGARTVADDDERLGHLDGRQVLPHTFKSGVLTGRAHSILRDDVVRERDRGVDLDFTLVELAKELTTALFVMLEEGVLVLEVSLGRHSLIVDLIPLICTDLDFDHVAVSAKLRQRLAVLRRMHSQCMAEEISLLHSLLRGGVHRRHPLSEQADRLVSLEVSQVFVELLTNESERFSLSVSSEEFGNDIPARVFRNELDEVLELRKNMLHESLEEASFANALTDVTYVEHPLECEFCVICECSQEVSDDDLFSCATVGRNLEVHVDEILARSLVCYCTIFGELLSLREDLVCFSVEVDHWKLSFGSISSRWNLIVRTMHFQLL